MQENQQNTEINDNSIRFTEEELKELLNLRNEYAKAINLFGQIHIERLALSEQVNALNEAERKNGEHYLSLQKKEEELLNKITEKYGEGSLDLNNGVFIKKDK